MDKDIRNLLLIYVVPICLISLFFVFFAPPMFSVCILAMITSAGLLGIGVFFLIDWLEKR